MNWYSRKPKPTLPDVPKFLPFVSKGDSKHDTSMKVDMLGPMPIDHKDFAFMTPLLERFQKLPDLEGVFFPKIEGGLARGEIQCTTSYVHMRATGTIVFTSKRLGMRMAYEAQISLTYIDGVKGLRLIMVPGRTLNKKVYRTVETFHKSYACVVKALITGFAGGSVFRKITSLPVETKT